MRTEMDLLRGQAVIETLDLCTPQASVDGVPPIA